MSFFNKRRFGSRKGGEIDPDEIFLDSSNLSGLDEQQFEGRIEKTITKRTIYSLGGFFVLVLLIFSYKLFLLQIRDGGYYLDKGDNNRLKHSVIFPERGIVYDRNGEELIWNSMIDDEEYAQRNYIDKNGLAHVLGYVSYPLKDTSGFYYDVETVGKDGVESIFNAKIKGENGLKIVEVDALSKVKSEFIIKPPKNGDNISLTIDSDLQEYIYKSIDNLSKQVGFKGGAGIIMSVENGEILALTSYPEYDSNIMSNSEDNNEIAKYIFNENNPFLNRVTSGLYIPGSIVKPFMALAALTEGVIDPYKQILSTGQISLPNPYFPELRTVFKDWKAHGWVDMRRALAVSSDVYFYEIGGGFEDQKGIGINNINKYMKMFGFGEQTGSDSVDEEEGIVPNPEWKKEVFDGEEWFVGNTYHTSIGQYGFQTTPVQVVRAISAVANNGRLLTPILVSDDKKNIGIIPIPEISKSSFEVVKEGMRDAVTEGTAQGLYVGYVDVAAKTGTAELGVSKKYVNSWIVGFFPYEKPKYTFAVVMEEGPKENMIGGLYVMRQVLDWMSINRPEYLEN